MASLALTLQLALWRHYLHWSEAWQLKQVKKKKTISVVRKTTLQEKKRPNEIINYLISCRSSSLNDT